ncbi:Ig-like domain-containing protein [Inconstantimicrobium mannanitabidum]|uniref:Uncharacterized protein n=1 Tax=Inconstantimicrobium mannanitabidum TaxID=1604901 RepID=A0ACB5RHL7_9CLOT|nr:Ig-like domain-containing protein [Clostridium sp. TW13]GKX68594.1 hypothetical protein rsdtw13_38520 [Clostridium sp. TW13]
MRGRKFIGGVTLTAFTMATLFNTVGVSMAKATTTENLKKTNILSSLGTQEKLNSIKKIENCGEVAINEEVEVSNDFINQSVGHAVDIRYILDYGSQIDDSKLTVYQKQTNGSFKEVEYCKLDTLNRVLRFYPKQGGIYKINVKPNSATDNNQSLKTVNDYTATFAALNNKSKSVFNSQDILQQAGSIPSDNGIWVAEEDREYISNLMHEVCGAYYYFDSKGYLRQSLKDGYNGDDSIVYSNMIDSIIRNEKIVIGRDTGSVIYNNQGKTYKKVNFNGFNSKVAMNKEHKGTVIVLDSKYFSDSYENKGELAHKLFDLLKVSNAVSVKEASTDGKKIARKSSIFPERSQAQVSYLASQAPVYYGPNASVYAKKGTVAENENVTIIAEENNYFVIEYVTAKGPQRGYIDKRSVENYVSISSSIEHSSLKPKQYETSNKGNNIEVFSVPACDHEVIGSLKPGTKVILLDDQTNRFPYIEYDTKQGKVRGYVYRLCLKSQTINIDNPVNNKTVSDNFKINGWALDIFGVDRVQILIDGKYVGDAKIGESRPDVKKVFPEYQEADKSGFSYNLDISKLSNGVHTVTARAENGGEVCAEKSKNFQISKLPVKMNVDTPTNGQGISNKFNVSGWVLNPSGVKSIEILIDGKHIAYTTIGQKRPDVKRVFPQYKDADNSGFNCTVTAGNITKGKHNVTVKVVGNDGSTSECSRIININK